MTWPALIWRNLFRRAARTLLTAIGVRLGVALAPGIAPSRAELSAAPVA